MLNRFFIWGVAIACAITAWGNPSSHDVNSCLNVHGLCPGSKELLTQCQKLWSDNVAAMYEISAALESNAVEKLSPKVMQKTFIAGINLQWDATVLQTMGEPTGYDMRLRGDQFTKVAYRAAEIYWGTPSGKKQYQKAVVALTREAPKRIKTIQAIQALIAKGDLEAADAAFRKAKETLWEDTLWIPTSERVPINKPFDEVQAMYESKLRQARTATHAKELQQVLASVTPDVARIVAKAQSVLTQVKASGKCQIDDKTMSGPQAFAALVNDWQTAHLNSIRCQGIYWALQNMQAASGDNHGPWQQQMAQLDQQMTAMLPELIAADATQLSGPQLGARYLEYLDQITPLLVVMSHPKLVAACETALVNMVSEHPPASQLVSAYRDATDDLLYWRRKLAASQAAEQQASFPPLNQVFHAACQSTAEYQGLFPQPGDSQLPTPTLRILSPWEIQVPVKKIADAKITARNLKRIGGGGPYTFAAYEQRTYVNVPTNFIDVSQAIASLQTDLLASDTMPPLTLSARLALESARRLDFQHTGGLVKVIHLESVIARFASFPSSASVLVPLPRQISDGEDAQRRMGFDQMAMRFDLLPLWVQHECFFASQAGSQPASQPAAQ